MTVPTYDEDAVRAQALARAVSDKLRESFGHTFEVLRDPQAFTALMIGANLATQSCETRINPNGTTTELTTVTLPSLIAVNYVRDTLFLTFEMPVGSSSADWVAAERVLRSGLRASSLDVAEPVGGHIQVRISTPAPAAPMES